MELFKKQFEKFRLITEEKLFGCFPEIDGEHGMISEACRYSLLAGGKRIRPVMCLAGAEMLGINYDEVMDFACAIEMIHTFSLIHDDLPGMDNDDFRRGKPTCHKVFGEAIAILAGDALLNKAYDNMINHCIKFPSQGKIEAMKIISEATGENGMIGGQVIDIQSEEHKIEIELLRKLHSMKTGALLKAPLMVPVSIADVNNDTKRVISGYADEIGLAFQIQDDILDVISTSEEMGKTVGKDAKSNKSTYVTLLGLDGAKTHLEIAVNKAVDYLITLEKMGYEVDFFKDLSYYLLKRKN